MKEKRFTRQVLSVVTLILGLLVTGFLASPASAAVGKLKNVKITDNVLTFDWYQGDSSLGYYLYIDSQLTDSMGSGLLVYSNRIDLLELDKTYDFYNTTQHVVGLLVYKDYKVAAAWQGIWDYHWDEYELIPENADARIVDGKVPTPEEGLYNGLYVHEISSSANSWQVNNSHNNDLDQVMTCWYRGGGLWPQDVYYLRFTESGFNRPSSQTIVPYRFRLDLGGRVEYSYVMATRASGVGEINASIEAIPSMTYTGKALKPKPVVKVNGNTDSSWFTETLVKDKDYKVTYSANKNAGTATVKVTGIGFYKGTLEQNFTIEKAKQPLKAEAKTASVKYSQLKIKNQEIAPAKAFKITKAQGKLTYTKISGSGKLSIHKTTGKITVKKGTEKGTYSMKVRIKAAGNKNYLSGSKTVTVKVQVK